MWRKNYQEYELKNINYSKQGYIVSETKEVTEDIRDLPKNYRVLRLKYKCADPEAHYWDMDRICVYGEGNKPICMFDRNYSGFVAGCYVEQNGKEYWITSADYQCIAIVNLTDSVVKQYVDIDDKQHGCGFCPISIDWDESVNKLYIDGCIWGCPYETMICEDIDFENPIEAFNNAQWESDYDDEEYEPEEETDE